MGFTVADALKLPSFSEAKLLAGKSGLNREIESISVCECNEFPVDLVTIGKDNLLFKNNEFYITSFYAIKDQAELVLDTIKLYYQHGSSGICIFDRFYDSFDQKALDFADSVGYPIISISRSVRYSDVIMDMAKAILSNNEDMINEAIIDELREMGIPPKRIKALSEKLYPGFKKYSFVTCVHYDLIEKINTKSLLDEVKNIENLYVTPYKEFILFFMTSDQSISPREIESILHYIKSTCLRFFQSIKLGVSSMNEGIDYLPEMINGAITACEVSIISDKNLHFYNEIGAYQLLMGCMNSNTKAFLMNFYESVLNNFQFINHEERKQALDLITLFVETNGNFHKMSKKSYQHQNTLRYRMNKLKKNCSLENQEVEFITLINLIYKINKIIESDYIPSKG